jgi:hypothetical protein
MVIEPEEAAFEHMHDIIDGVRAGEAPIGDRYAGFGDGDVAATHISGAAGEG